MLSSFASLLDALEPVGRERAMESSSIKHSVDMLGADDAATSAQAISVEEIAAREEMDGTWCICHTVF